MTKRCPASSGTSLRHSCEVCGQPWSSTTGSPSPSVTTCTVPRDTTIDWCCMRLGERDRLELDVEGLRPSADGDEGTGRRVLAEVLGVDRVDVVPVGAVADQHGDLEHLVER